ncbi:MAG: TetR family transcriptional regulator [Clostridiales bacterium]|nr:TetR family transcriptional regulator [Clostridiales bacterium]
MFNYKTIEEMAEKWGVTTRHIQNLCRTGKIESAVKRAGAWFIPSDAPSPVKNTKIDDRPFMFVGTKKKIFYSAIRLFTERGYENVSLNDIADTIGIRQSAIYNHFKSKQEILDTIYDFYHYYQISNRPGPEELEALLETGSIFDIITKGFIYQFEEGVIEQMLDIAKIVFQRASTDAKAKELFQDLILNEAIVFVEDGLGKAVDAGRFAPFDTRSMSILINCIRLYTLIWLLVGPPPGILAKQVEDEYKLYALIANLITDLKPPLL